MSPLAPQVPASLHMTLLDLEIQVFYYYTCLEKDLIIILLQDAKIVSDRNLAVLVQQMGLHRHLAAHILKLRNFFVAKLTKKCLKANR